MSGSMGGAELHAALRSVAEAYVDAMRARWDDALVAAALFGSVARGEAGPRDAVLDPQGGLPPRRGVPAVTNGETRLPAEFQADVDRWASISRRLRREREVSFYGDDETGAPPQLLYTEDDARAALEEARFVHGRCRALGKALGADEGERP